jgi:hypothetical protein
MFCFRQEHGRKTNRMTAIFNYSLHLERNLGRRLKKEIAKEERKWKQEMKDCKKLRVSEVCMCCRSLVIMQTRFVLRKREPMQCSMCNEIFHKKYVPICHQQYIPNDDDSNVFICHSCYVVMKMIWKMFLYRV